MAASKPPNQISAMKKLVFSSSWRIVNATARVCFWLYNNWVQYQMLGGGKLFEKSFSSHLAMPNNQSPSFQKLLKWETMVFLPQHLILNLAFFRRLSVVSK